MAEGGVLIAYETHTAWLIVDRRGNMRVVQTNPQMGRSSLKTDEFAYRVTLRVPKDRIPVPFGEIKLELPDRASGGTITIESALPVAEPTAEVVADAGTD